MKQPRYIIAVVVLLVMVVAALGSSSAFAGKNQLLPQSAAPAANEAGPRLQGTVDSGTKTEVLADDCSDINTYCVSSAQTDLYVETLTELPAGVPAPEGRDVVVTRIIQVNSDSITQVGEEINFTLIPSLGEGEVVAYWNGTEWVEVAAGNNGTYIIPTGTALPITIAVFTK